MRGSIVTCLILFVSLFGSVRADDEITYEPYGFGTVAYEHQDIKWFAAVDQEKGTVGVVIVTETPLQLTIKPGDFKSIHADKIQSGKVVTFFTLDSPMCKREQLEDSTCDYKGFAGSIVERLARIPEFSSVCVMKFIDVPGEGAIPCSPVK